MTGTYEHAIDAKGRLFIPAKLREELGVSFYLAMGVDACLAIYPQATWDRFTEKFASLPMSQSKAMRPLFANAAKCEPDAQGRILIPVKLRQYAALERGRAGNEGQEVPPLARITIDNMADIVQRQRRCVEELLAAVGEAP